MIHRADLEKIKTAAAGRGHAVAAWGDEGHQRKVKANQTVPNPPLRPVHILYTVSQWPSFHSSDVSKKE